MAPLLWIGLMMLLLGQPLPAIAQEVNQTGNGWEYEHVYSWDMDDVRLLILENLGGHLELSATSGNALEITQTIPFGDIGRTEAMSRGSGMALESSRSGSRRAVAAVGVPRGTRLQIRIPMHVDVELDADWGAIEASGLFGNLDLRQGGGTIEIENHEGNVDIRSDGGVIALEDIVGSVSISSDGGGVEVARVRDSVSITTGGGNIDLELVSGDASVTTAGGNVDVFGIRGNLSAVTSAGTIEVMNVEGDASLSSGGGSIEAADIDGSLTANTSGGDVEAEMVGGPIRIETLAGDVELSGVRNTVRVIAEVGDIELEVADARFLERSGIEIDLGHGDIELVLPRDTNAMLIANVQESGGIDISNEDWDVEVVRTRGQARDQRSRRAEVRIGKGGGEIQIRLLSGEITVDHE